MLFEKQLLFFVSVNQWPLLSVPDVIPKFLFKEQLDIYH